MWTSIPTQDRGSHRLRRCNPQQRMHRWWITHLALRHLLDLWQASLRLPTLPGWETIRPAFRGWLFRVSDPEQSSAEFSDSRTFASSFQRFMFARPASTRSYWRRQHMEVAHLKDGAHPVTSAPGRVWAVRRSAVGFCGLVFCT